MLHRAMLMLWSTVLGSAAGAKVVGTPPTFWTLAWDGQRLLATISPPALKTDFMIFQQVVDAQPPTGELYVGMDTHANFQSSGIESIVYRWQVTADSVRLVQMQGTGAREVSNIQAFPILRRDVSGALIADVSSLFDVRWRLAPPTVTSASDHLEVDVPETFRDQRVVWHWRITPLPTHPMRPRASEGQGTFLTIQSAACGASTNTYITRWRLEKTDPRAAVSDVVHPIVYVIDPTTPPKWLPWVKRGVEEWLPAFEAVGLRHALVVREVPKNASSPWVLTATKQTLLLWATHGGGQDQENGQDSTTPGLTYIVPDPRTGEILRAAIHLYEGALQVAWRTFMDSTISYTDSSAGYLLQAMVAHEVGHSLGLPHNFGATPPSIMGYTFFMPRTDRDPHGAFADHFTHVGAVDWQTIAWGYRPLSTTHPSAVHDSVCP